MKKIMLCLLVCVALWSCEGETGPVGPPGPAIVGQTFEFDGINFQYEPDVNLWSALIDVPTDIEVLESDAILVYRIEDGGNGPLYSLIPQNFFTPNGTISYVYNHTPVDVELLIDGNFNMANLDPVFTDNQAFRFVVVPSDFAKTYKDQIQSFDDLQALDIQLQQF